jgi:hypothetical protein
MNSTLKQPVKADRKQKQPANATIEALAKSIEQSLRVEGYIVSPMQIKQHLEAHFEE